MKIKNKIEILDKKAFKSGDDNPISLVNGKVGHCIYLYSVGRISGNKQFQQMAELLTGEIFEQVTKIKAFDIKNGLSGIGLGFDYLIENKYMEGNVNDILEEVDNALFKQICNHNNLNNSDVSLQLQLIYYFTVRLKTQKKNSENEYFFKEVIIDAINFISEKIYSIFSEESQAFNMENTSILSLLVLSQCDKLYKEKIGRILKDISFSILSKIPVLHANRLYLLYAMDRINKKIKTNGWSEHIKLLARETDIEHIIEKELADDIYFSNGLSAIYFLLSGLQDYFPSYQTCKYKELIINKIENSPIWDRLIDDDFYMKHNNGLFSGYKGTSLLLHKHYKDENRFN
jgi:hypothetical protein